MIRPCVRFRPRNSVRRPGGAKSHTTCKFSHQHSTFLSSWCCYYVWAAPVRLVYPCSASSLTFHRLHVGLATSVPLSSRQRLCCLCCLSACGGEPAGHMALATSALLRLAQPPWTPCTRSVRRRPLLLLLTLTLFQQRGSAERSFLLFFTMCGAPGGPFHVCQPITCSM